MTPWPRPFAPATPKPTRRPPPNLAPVARTYFVRTFGCQMNEHDSERIAGLLEADGLAPAATPAT